LLQRTPFTFKNSSTSNRLRSRLNVSIQPEEILRIVLGLDGHKPFIVLAVGIGHDVAVADQVEGKVKIDLTVGLLVQLIFAIVANVFAIVSRWEPATIEVNK
jgi:hypothetical protein